MLGGGQSNGRAEVSDPAADVVKGGGVIAVECTATIRWNRVSKV